MATDFYDRRPLRLGTLCAAEARILCSECFEGSLLMLGAGVISIVRAFGEPWFG